MGELAYYSDSEERFFATREEYLTWEEKSQQKHEYVNGEIVAMAGGTVRHNDISGNIFGQLYTNLRGKNCRPFNSDMKLDIPKKGNYVYPDAMVICGKVELVEGRQDIVRNPALIIEVLSPKTENFDRSEKFKMYQSLESFQEYALIYQDSYRIETYFRHDASHWSYFIYTDLEKKVKFQSINIEVSMKDIYENIELEVENS